MVACDVVGGGNLCCFPGKGEGCVHIRVPGIHQISREGDAVWLGLFHPLQKLCVALPEGSVVQIGHLHYAETVKGGGKLLTFHRQLGGHQGRVSPGHPGNHAQKPSQKDSQKDPSSPFPVSFTALCHALCPPMVSLRSRPVRKMCCSASLVHNPYAEGFRILSHDLFQKYLFFFSRDHYCHLSPIMLTPEIA